MFLRTLEISFNLPVTGSIPGQRTWNRSWHNNDDDRSSRKKTSNRWSTILSFEYFFPEINCGSPGILPNGWLEGSRTTLHAVVTFRCQEGMTFEGPSYRTICQADGRWSHPLPRCYGQSSPSCSPFSLSRDIFDRQIIASNPPICGVTAGPCPHSKTQKCRYQYCSYKVTQKSMRPASIQVLCPTHGTGFVERLGISLGKKIASNHEKSIDDVLRSDKEFVFTKAQTHNPVHGAVYWCSETSVIPLSYTGNPFTTSFCKNRTNLPFAFTYLALSFFF